MMDRPFTRWLGVKGKSSGQRMSFRPGRAGAGPRCKGTLDDVTTTQGPVKLKLQLMSQGVPVMGPGKALLMAAVQREGSISAAARSLDMSYRRAWLLVQTLNVAWRDQVIEAQPGGGARSGARLTPFGLELLNAYREVEGRMRDAAEGEALDWMLAAMVGLPDAEVPAGG
jgi:molybdate transport system regulatory protein